MKARTNGGAIEQRRGFLRAAAWAPAFVLAGCATAASRTRGGAEDRGERGEAEATPGEDLMQEWSPRAVYAEAARRIEPDEPLDLGSARTR